MRPIRWVFALECLITAVGGGTALFAPAKMAEQMVPQVPPFPALDLVRMLGVMWLVVSAAQVLLLWRGTREAWSIVLGALLLGDVLHIGAHAVLISDGGLLNAAACFSLISSVMFALARCLALRRPALLEKR